MSEIDGVDARERAAGKRAQSGCTGKGVEPGVGVCRGLWNGCPAVERSGKPQLLWFPW